MEAKEQSNKKSGGGGGSGGGGYDSPLPRFSSPFSDVQEVDKLVPVFPDVKTEQKHLLRISPRGGHTSLCACLSCRSAAGGVPSRVPNTSVGETSFIPSILYTQKHRPLSLSLFSLCVYIILRFAASTRSSATDLHSFFIYILGKASFPNPRTPEKNASATYTHTAFNPPSPAKPTFI